MGNRSRISEKRHISQLDPASTSPLPFSPDPQFHWEGSIAHPGCRQWADSRICAGSPWEQGLAHRNRQQQVCKDGTIMKVRRLFLSTWDELSWGYVNAVPVFYPYLTPSLSPVLVQCSAHHCTSHVCLSPSWLFVPLLACTLPLPSEHPSSGFTHSNHLLLVFAWNILGRGGSHSREQGSVVNMFTQSMPLSDLMESGWLADICSHATGRESFAFRWNIHCNTAASTGGHAFRGTFALCWCLTAAYALRHNVIPTWLNAM